MGGKGTTGCACMYGMCSTSVYLRCVPRNARHSCTCVQVCRGDSGSVVGDSQEIQVLQALLCCSLVPASECKRSSSGSQTCNVDGGAVPAPGEDNDKQINLFITFCIFVNTFEMVPAPVDDSGQPAMSCFSEKIRRLLIG